jgi:hypothetical protein
MKKSILLLSLAIFTLASCSNINKESNYPKSKEEQELERMGKLTGDEGMVLFGSTKKRGSSVTDAINVNSYLWRASLDMIYFMPLLSADPFGGTILTDWYANSPNAKERFKFNIIIVGAELRSDAVKVSAFKQVKDASGRWKESVANPQLARDIEDKILLRARELKVNS